ncbi:MAG: MIP/aquaporin family protein [Acidimicrobiales bacterium]|jgi:aquaporin Z
MSPDADHDEHPDETVVHVALDTRGPLRSEPPWVLRPFDRAYEWRRQFAEVFGTFLLVVAASGGPVVNGVHPGSVSLDARAVTPGLMVMAIIYFMGMVSGAHLNPAVTLSFAARGNFPWAKVPGYVACQMVGAVAAALFLRAMFGNVAHLGATLPGATPLGKAAVIEMVLTLGLISVILGTASGARNVGAHAAIAIGAYIALAGLWAAPVTGASMNPARSLGPALVSGDWSGWWVYVVGPLAGGMVAVAVAWVLRGPPSRAADTVAQGDVVFTRTSETPATATVPGPGSWGSSDPTGT